MKSNNISTISINYAQALDSVNLDNACIKRELSEILETFRSSEDLRIVMSNSSISYSKKIEIAEEVFAGKISSEMLNLLKILIQKNRISELNSIYNAFEKLDNQNSGIKSVEIVSSIDLSESIKQKIIQKLEKKLNCQILPAWQVDKSIIAGLVFKYDDYIVDTSILAKLKQLSKQ